MGTVPHWGTADGAEWWDTVILGGEILPGIWWAESEPEAELDVKKVKGKDGANYTDNGLVPAPVTLTGQITTEAEWQEWQRIQPVIFPRAKGQKRSPLELTHPEPNSKGIFSVYVNKFPALKLDNGILTITIQAKEYLPAPKPKPRKGTGTVKNKDYYAAKTQAEAGGAALNAMLLQALGPPPGG